MFSCRPEEFLGDMERGVGAFTGLRVFRLTDEGVQCDEALRLFGVLQ